MIDKPLLLSGNVWYDMVIQMHNVSELIWHYFWGVYRWSVYCRIYVSLCLSLFCKCPIQLNGDEGKSTDAQFR